MEKPELKKNKTDIKIADTTKRTLKTVKDTIVRSKESAAKLSENEKSSPEEYATDQAEYLTDEIMTDGGRLVKKTVKRSYRDGKRLYRNIREKRQTGKAYDAARQTSTELAKTANRNIKVQRQSIKTSEQTVKSTVKTAKQTLKTAERAAKTAEKTARTTAKASKIAAERAREAAELAYQSAVAFAKAIVAAVKAIAAGISKLAAAIAAGGWTAVIVILIICMVGLIAASCFGIFFSSEDTGTGMTLQTAITDINKAYQDKITEIKDGTSYDVLEMSGSRAVWQEVLAVYSVKTTTDPNNPQEVASMDDSKLQLLKNIFWEMNSITSRTASITENVITETDDGKGNIVETVKRQTRTYLYITVTHKTVEEMSAQYGFDDSRKEQLTELLSEENKQLWSQVLYGFSTGNEAIVSVALSQIGNIGGGPYWSWYGFDSRVEWCACFVSWCANECGYIDTGIIPKYAGCVNGVAWFTERGLWQDNTYTPKPGDIIFFDWNSKGSSGPQDGEADHTGIVEKVENGFVYTIEGNSGDSCREKQYKVGYYEILGYGTPSY